MVEHVKHGGDTGDWYATSAGGVDPIFERKNANLKKELLPPKKVVAPNC